MSAREADSRLPALAAALALVVDGGWGGAAAAHDGSAPADALCRQTLKLQSGTAAFGACADSLAATVRSLGAGDALAATRDACLVSGLQPGTAAAALCILDRRDKTPPAPAPIRVVAPRDDGPAYTRAAFGLRRAREQRACASLALEPGTRGFARCVSGLDAALFDADHPSQ